MFLSVEFWACLYHLGHHPWVIYLFKYNKRNTKKVWNILNVYNKGIRKLTSELETLELVMDVVFSVFII